MTARELRLAALMAASLATGQALLGLSAPAAILAFLISVVGMAAALVAVRPHPGQSGDQQLAAPLRGRVAAAGVTFLAGSALLVGSLLLLSLRWAFFEGLDLLQLGATLLLQSGLCGLLGGIVGFASWVEVDAQ